MQNHQGPSAVGRQLFVLIAFSLGMTASLQSQSIPVDVKPTCTVTSSQFDSWYASGHQLLLQRAGFLCQAYR